METQILEFEKKYWQAMENRDFNTVKNLTHFPCIVAGKQGVRSVDEATFQTMFESGINKPIKILEISGIESQTIHESTAIIAYIIELEYTLDGQKSALKCACTSTWVKKNDGWVCAMHTESDLESL
uniref:nuclear transport factor 2 family protein n=1 Tax=Pedobacter schmidteae TaxID=2201271 RepID=UPI000EB0A581|nr:nuclear transport factor 2 family protein [Pedobacter schmidteae]